ncbi:bifunctional RNA-binding domain superfamily/RNA recognition motif domain/Nucleotide-binding alpha-beta plait domain superfamily [Babesia duncani]|uniref:Bifunctional RNA-binding domain superfamily/RNA recognition motif domain/Nucleotide-binding alpha-beta plait domain superfamily n=1 Tax=Babesia duncani TaxID=323732 RepID=A0AAD9PNG9_9APIC|nr:bifunctional RNA-binding domain superfamily/RNA recognition motif domain/Nucleotide-binding alpha-beta plait domain superfamily [Babesia duncani]
MRGMHDRFGSDHGYNSRMPYPRRDPPEYLDHARPYSRDYDRGHYDRDSEYRHYNYAPDRRYHHHHPVRERSLPYERVPVPRGPLPSYDRHGYEPRDFSYSRASVDRGSSIHVARPAAMHSVPPNRGPVRYSYQYPNKVFVGNLSDSVTEADVAHAFQKFGPLNRVEFRKKYALVDFIKARDADLAIYEMNGQLFYGSRIRVQPHCDLNKRPSFTREPNLPCQITVLNLDASVSWQDLKDFSRRAGNVQYASILTKGQQRFGLVEFTNDQEVQRALEQLNDKQLGKNKVQLVHCPLDHYLEQFTDSKFDRDTFEAEEYQDHKPLYKDNDEAVDYD